MKTALLALIYQGKLKHPAMSPGIASHQAENKSLEHK
jgi:hypothetical protein